MLSSLPVLDLSRLDAGPAEADAFRAELRRVTHEVGFFYLVGHGVDQDLIDELLAVSRRFFELPAEAKLAIENVNSPQFRGYTRVGGELTHGDIDWREQIDIGAERDTVEPGPGMADYWRLEGPNLWPDALPELREVAVRGSITASLRPWIARLDSMASRITPLRSNSIIAMERLMAASLALASVRAQEKRSISCRSDL